MGHDTNRPDVILKESIRFYIERSENAYRRN